MDGVELLSFPTKQQIVTTASIIIDFAGDYVSYGPYWRRQYEDQKVRLVCGVMPSKTDPGTMSVTFIMIFIKMNDASDHIGYGLPAKSKDNETVVYHAKPPFQYAEYYRPGKWERYLEKLNNQFHSQSDERLSLNEIPVGDDALFSGLD